MSDEAAAVGATRRSVDLGEVDPARSRHAGRRSAVTLTDDLAVVGRADGTVIALERESLEERWRWPDDDRSESGDGRKKEDGSERDADPERDDETERDDASIVSATPFAGGIAVGTRGPAGTIRLHDAETGTVRWQYEGATDVGEPQRDTRFFLPFVAALESHVDRLYAAVRRYERRRTESGAGDRAGSDGDRTADDGGGTAESDDEAETERHFESVVYAFEPDGSVAWASETDASPIALDVRDDRVAVAYNRCPGAFQHGLAVLDAVDGNTRWHWDPGTEGQRRVGDVSLVRDGAIVASHGDYRGYRLADDGGERWRVDLATPETVGDETLYAYPNHVHATEDGAVFVTGNTYAEESRETDALHPQEHTAVGVDRRGERRWTADVGGFASGVATDADRVAVPGAQHFRTRDEGVHGVRLLDLTEGVVSDAAADGVVTAAALAADTLAAIEEPVAYHDGDGELGAYRLHLFEH